MCMPKCLLTCRLASHGRNWHYLNPTERAAVESRAEALLDTHGTDRTMSVALSEASMMHCLSPTSSMQPHSRMWDVADPGRGLFATHTGAMMRGTSSIMDTAPTGSGSLPLVRRSDSLALLAEGHQVRTIAGGEKVRCH